MAGKHNLIKLPLDHPFTEFDEFQCSKCGCTFSEHGLMNADILLSCSLEQSLREYDAELVEERPIVVSE